MTTHAAYAWGPASSLSEINTRTPFANPTITTTYTVTVTDANGCTDTDQVTVFVEDCSTPPVCDTRAIASEDQTICSGETAQLVVTTHSAYVWGPASSLSSANTRTPVANPTTTTTYTVTVTDANGCTDTDQVTVFVEGCGTPPVCDTEAIACEDKTICSGETVQLVVTTHAAYTWGPASSLSGANTGTPFANPTTTTTYTVTVTDANGCTDTDQVTVFVQTCGGTPPVCNVEAIACEDKAICSGESIQLVVNTHDAYVWSPASSLSGANTGTPTATPTTTTTYTVTVTDANGCTDTDQVTIFVENCNTPPPLTCQVDAGENITICQGQSMLLNGSGAVSYSWSPNTGISNANTATPLVFPTATTTYTLLGITADGSFCEDQVTVVVGGPRPEAVASEDQTICEGESAQLVVSTSQSYAWAPTVSLTNANTRTPIAAPTGTTTYIVTVTNADGCTDTDQVTVFVENCNTPPPITTNCDDANFANAGSNVAICPNESITLLATGGTNYAWSPADGLSNPNIANPAASPSSTTVYTVTVTDANGCTDTDDIQVLVSLPIMTSIITTEAGCCGEGGGSIVVNASGGFGNLTYNWGTSEL